MPKTYRIDARYIKGIFGVSVIKYPAGGDNGLLLHDSEGYSPLKASTNLCASLEKDEVAIKTWSENEDVLPELIRLGIVSEPVRYIAQGFVQAPICKILISVEDRS